MIRLYQWISPYNYFTSPLCMDSSSKQYMIAAPSQGQFFSGVNPLIMPIPQYFLSGCIDLYLYLAQTHSNDYYCRPVFGLFLLVSASLLYIFKEFSSEHTVLDSPVHTLWLNITAEPVICLTFLPELPQ